MRHDHGDSFVEFLEAGSGDGPDEELVSPAGFPRLRRARLPLLVALVALIAVNVAAGPRRTPSAGAPTVTVTPTPTGHRPTKATPTTARTPPRPVRISCPAGASCATVIHTPPRIAEAIRTALPAARHVHTVTTFAHEDAPGSFLFTRRVTARVGAARLRIRIRSAGARDLLGFNASETPARTLVTVGDHLGGRLVSLRFVARPGYDPDFDALRTLARDRQLTAPAPAR